MYFFSKKRNSILLITTSILMLSLFSVVPFSEVNAQSISRDWVSMSKQIETLRSMLNGVANALRAEMKKLNERLDEQEERLNGHETRISALEGRADEHEGRISALEGRVDKHEGRISALEARVAELERRFAGQGGRMNDQQMRIDNQEAVLLRMSNCANRGMIYAPGVSGTGRDGCATTLGELRAPDHLKGLR